MTPTERLLEQLERVRVAGDGRWMALCPAHLDRTPSLSIRELGDGTVLVRCFAACTAADVVAAVGLELRDLFPSINRPRNRQHHQRHDAAEIRLAIARGMIRRGERLTKEDLGVLQDALAVLWGAKR